MGLIGREAAAPFLRADSTRLFYDHNVSQSCNSLKILLFCQIFLTKKKDNNSIKENYIKLYLTNDKDEAFKGFDKNSVPTFNELFSLNNKHH